MDKTFHIEIITPGKVIFTGPIIDFVAPGVMGTFEVLRNHAPFISALKTGEMRVRQEDGYDEYFAVSGGFVEVRDNHVTVLAETCEKAMEIDIHHAMEVKEWARKKLEERASIDPEPVRQALIRAQNRLKIVERRVRS